jgi:hypothetical protein
MLKCLSVRFLQVSGLPDTQFIFIETKKQIQVSIGPSGPPIKSGKVASFNNSIELVVDYLDVMSTGSDIMTTTGDEISASQAFPIRSLRDWNCSHITRYDLFPFDPGTVTLPVRPGTVGREATKSTSLRYLCINS